MTNLYALHSYKTDVLEELGCLVPGDELVFGLELESMRTNTNPLAETGVGIWKKDSSCWAEYVTRPMTFEEVVEWALKAPLHTIRPSKECGMHVHINRKALTQREACHLALLLSDDEHLNDLNFMSGRKATQHCKKVKQDELGTSRYEAVNLTNYTENKNTVEIRVFSSTNKAEELIARMLWVRKLVEFVKSPSASEHYSDFLNWEHKTYGMQSKRTLSGELVRLGKTEVKLPNPLHFLVRVGEAFNFSDNMDQEGAAFYILMVLKGTVFATAIAMTPVFIYILVILGFRAYNHHFTPDVQYNIVEEEQR